MMPLGAPSISKYGSLVRRDAQIVALRAQCARTARALRLRLPLCILILVPRGCFSQLSLPNEAFGASWRPKSRSNMAIFSLLLAWSS